MVSSLEKTLEPGIIIIIAAFIYTLIYILVPIRLFFKLMKDAAETSAYILLFISFFFFVISLVLIGCIFSVPKRRILWSFLLIITLLITVGITTYLLYRYSSLIWMIVYIILSIIAIIFLLIAIYYDGNRIILKHEHNILEYEHDKEYCISEEDKKKFLMTFSNEELAKIATLIPSKYSEDSEKSLEKEYEKLHSRKINKTKIIDYIYGKRIDDCYYDDDGDDDD